jgi:hypothetical protein
MYDDPENIIAGSIFPREVKLTRAMSAPTMKKPVVVLEIMFSACGSERIDPRQYDPPIITSDPTALDRRSCTVEMLL